MMGSAEAVHDTKMSKSAIQFPKSAPLPLKLIGEMAAFRAREAADQTKAKAKG